MWKNKLPLNKSLCFIILSVTVANAISSGNGSESLIPEDFGEIERLLSTSSTTSSFSGSFGFSAKDNGNTDEYSCPLDRLLSPLTTPQDHTKASGKLVFLHHFEDEQLEQGKQETREYSSFFSQTLKKAKERKEGREKRAYDEIPQEVETLRQQNRALNMLLCEAMHTNGELTCQKRDLEKENKFLNTSINFLDDEVQKHSKINNILKKENKSLKDEYNELLAFKQMPMTEFIKLMERLKIEKINTQKALEFKKQEITSLKRTIEMKEFTINSLIKKLNGTEGRENHYAEQRTRLIQKQKESAKLLEKIHELNGQNHNLKQLLKEKEEENNTINAELQMLYEQLQEQSDTPLGVQLEQDISKDKEKKSSIGLISKIRNILMGKFIKKGS